MIRHVPWLALALGCVGCAQDVVIGYADAEIVLPEIRWPSGAHAGNEVQDYADFGAWRGRSVDLAHLFPDRLGGFQDLVTPAWPVDMMEAFSGRLVLSLPLYPESEGNNQDCAAGLYDAEWQKLGTFLVERGRSETIIRLGWGLNDNDHAWRADADVTDWIACFRRVALAIRSTDAAVRIEWSFNEQGPPQITNEDPYAAYPGDDVVDYVGMELFDHYPAVESDTVWEQRCSGPTGLCTLFDFARDHGKTASVTEWGLVSCGEQAGGDNPFFIQKVVETFAEHADVLGFEAYFEDGNLDVCSKLDDARHANAAERYRLLYAER